MATNDRPQSQFSQRAGDPLASTCDFSTRELVEQPGLRQLGQYQLLVKLGEGGMGAVYKAQHTLLKRVVALKVLPAERMKDPLVVARFRQEMEAVGQLQHPNIVAAHDAGSADGTHFLVMEFVEGIDLQKLVKRLGCLPIAEACELVRQAAVGLQHAHEHGLIHRDIKPSNLMLTLASGGRQSAGTPPDTSTGALVKILDLGLARLTKSLSVAERLTVAGQVMGTPDYMAPEQCEDAHAVDIRADIYSLGCTLYHLLVGSPPFSGPQFFDSPFQKMKAHQEVPVPPIQERRPQVPDALAAVLDRMLAKKPADRFATPAEVAAALLPFTEGCNLLRLLRRVSSSDPAPEAVTPTADVPARASPADTPTAPPQAPDNRATSGIPERHPQSTRRKWLITFAVVSTVCLLIGMRLLWRMGPSVNSTSHQVAEHYRGWVDVLVERTTDRTTRLLRLNERGALPLRHNDKFRIEGEVNPPAYLYVLWIDPGPDITPVYPWDPKVGWGSRPAQERPVGKISLPVNVGLRYTAPEANPGVATIVLLARPAPWNMADAELKARLEELPNLPLPPGGDVAAVWFDNFVEVRESARLRTFGVVGSDDAFARWQGELQKRLGDQAAFQTAVSFARTGGK